MNFAKKILSKYGWKEGDGLGKNNNGIAKPLKASLKFDNAGFGADPASEFNNKWWERCFNEAASNVDVKQKDDGEISMKIKDVESVEISTKGYSVKKLKKARKSVGAGDSGQYQNFLQAAVLTNGGGEVSAQNAVVDDITVTPVKVLTDEELFRACGGRTAHKAARHGLKLNGKLARLEQQEREILAKMQEATVLHRESKSVAELVTLGDYQSEKKKSKKRKVDEEGVIDDTLTAETEVITKEKTMQIADTALNKDTEPTKKKKKKKKRKCESAGDD